MAFVHVPSIGLDTQRTQCAHTTDAEHHLLCETHTTIATIELKGDATIGLEIGWHLSV